MIACRAEGGTMTDRALGEGVVGPDGPNSDASPDVRIADNALRDLRKRLAAGRTALILRAEEPRAVSGLILARRMTTLMDQLVETVWANSMHQVMARGDGLAGEGLRGLSLLAIGSFGRRELCPYSDLDILILRESGCDGPAVSAFSQSFFYGLWDLGLEVGHVLGTEEEIFALAQEDHSFLTSLLDARPLVSGHVKLHIRKKLLSGRNADSFIAAKNQELKTRREKYGKTVFLLEPNLKEGEGGLRDFQTLMWIARARWGAESLSDLVRMGVCYTREREALRKSYGFLLRLRVELHAVARRRQDLMSFEYQERIAEKLAYFASDEAKVDRKVLGIERFMRAYYFHASRIRELSDRLIERCQPSKPLRPHTTHRGPNGFMIRDGAVSVGSPKAFEQDPSALLGIYRVSQELNLPISASTQQIIAEAKRFLNSRWRRDPSTVRAFLEILECPTRDGSVLEALQATGVLWRMIPEYLRIKAKWQWSLYHVYTVDVHSIGVFKWLKRFRMGDFAAEHPKLTQFIQEMARPSVLYMAALLHDVGKGWPRDDHSKRGAKVAVDVGTRLAEAEIDAWSASDTQDLVWLVENHLILSDISQRRDISDPDLVAQVAQQARTVERLRSLYLLTVADMMGTSPKVWTEWKGRLLERLFDNVNEVLWSTMSEQDIQDEAHRDEGRRGNVQERLWELVDPSLYPGLRREAVVFFCREMPRRYLLTALPKEMLAHLVLWHRVSRHGGVELREHRQSGDVSLLEIACPDRPGLLALLAGSLAKQGVPVLSAQIYSFPMYEDPRRCALDLLFVANAYGNLRIEGLRANLERFLADVSVPLDLVLDSPSGLPEKAKPFVKTEIRISNDVSEEETVLDVFCEDRIGVLHTIAGVLSREGVAVNLAKISTQGDRVADGFYVTDQVTGKKITDPERLRVIRSSLEAQL
jgi:[protein-PII] uridylyltransferase